MLQLGRSGFDVQAGGGIFSVAKKVLIGIWIKSGSAK